MSAINQNRIDEACTDVSKMVETGKVSERVVKWLEDGEGYPESFTVEEMEAIYAYARLGRWCWFKENQP